jgi:ribosomal protein S3AE
MVRKETKVITRRKKFQEIEIPVANTQLEVIGDTPEEVAGRTMKLDLTRQLKGKSAEVVVKVKHENEKLIAHPIKMKLMSYFIRRMIRKRISYVEDSFETPSQESMIQVKPFLITRKRVSRAVRKTLRNKTKNWLEDYISQKTDEEIFNDILYNKLQKPLSLILKKTYPLSLCEIRVLSIKRPLEKEEVPKKIKKKVEEKTIEETEVIDQMKEIEDAKIKEAEKEIKKAQKEASKKEEKVKKVKKEELKEMKEEIKKTTKEKTEKKE